MDEVNITIIGAGVVGLAIASELSQKFENIVVLEKHNTFGQETSSRNSEVIHSGIYYPEGSLKAILCVEGARQLYKICKQYSIPHRRLGKLIVAAEQTDIKTLEELLNKGLKNNVKNLSIIDRSDINKIERNTTAIAALYSPNTGIIDSHSLMKHFFNVAKDKRVLFAFNVEVNRLNKEKDGFVVCVKQDDYQFKSKMVINCAGLSSDCIAELLGIDIQKSGYKLKYCKGSYFAYDKKSPIKMLVYPVPRDDLTGLGIHATLDLGGRLRFGPDVEYVDFEDYKVDACKKELFYNSAVKIIKNLDREAFIPDMAGIRPKIRGDGIKDFVIKHEIGKDLVGFINLIGIESPGLTASPAIAKMVTNIVSTFMN